MASITHLGYLPFCIPSAQPWDGLTYYTGEYLYEPSNFAQYALSPFLFSNIPSASSIDFTPVYGQGTFYPVGFTLNELMELYWRVAAFEVTTKLLETDSGDESYGYAILRSAFAGDSYHYFTNGYGPIDYYGYSGYNGTSERSLICIDPDEYYSKNFGAFLEISNDDDTITFAPTGTMVIADDIPDLMPVNSLDFFRGTPSVPLSFNSVGIAVSIFIITTSTIFGGSTLPPIVKDESSGLYYPYIYSCVLNYVYSSHTLLTEVGGSTGRTIDIFGKSINLYGPYGDPLASDPITIAPKYWWPYDGGSGPIYDVNTGSPL